MEVKDVVVKHRDAKHPEYVKAVAAVQLDLGNGNTITVQDLRVIQNRNTETLWINVPTRYGPNGHTPLIQFSRKLHRQLEDAILEAYGKMQDAAVEAAAKQADNAQQTGGAR